MARPALDGNNQVVLGQDAEDEPQWLGSSSKPKLSLKTPSISKLLASPKGAETSDARVKYDQADRLFQQASSAQGDARIEAFRSAAGLYGEVAEEATSQSLKEDALCMHAECLFFANQYPKAVNAFDELVKQFPRTRHMDRVDKRRFAIAQYWEQQVDGFSFKPNFTNGQQPKFDTFGHALRVYNRIRFDDPTGKLADDATMAAAVANFEAGRYAIADSLFEDLRDNFPSSEHQFQCHLLLLKCKMKRYQGPNYDGTVLNEAEELIRQMLVQFPGEADPHRESLEKEAKEIRLMQAERLYVKAQYRDRRKEYLAAKMLYEQLRNEYGDTSLALEAESRLAKMEGLPDRPEERLQWLAELFPKEEQPKPLIATGGTGGKLR
jgi:outer membrane protein assembly factor BamD (BamD/ComL family)